MADTMTTQAERDKQRSMELAEESRETEWRFPSFTAELFRGNFRWDLMHPYPEQTPEDRAEGDRVIAQFRGLFETCIDPIKIHEDGAYPQEALDRLAQIGAFGLKIPKEYGGLGLSVTNYARVLHFIGSYCQSTVTWVSAHQSIGVPEPLKLAGTEEQKKKFLPRIAKGAISAFALTEPDVGSDPARMKTTATPVDGGEAYLINGDKLWCTNGPDARIIVVMARTPSIVVDGKEKQQITAFIVETDAPGVEVVHRCRFMGLEGLSNGLLRFTDVKVPKEHIIGKPGQGLKLALQTLNTGRLGIPASTAGTAKALLKECETWVNERVQWGAPIGKHQSIAKKVANMAADTFAIDAIVWLVCAFADRENADIRLEAAIAKYFCTETSWRLLDDWIQIRGGRGYEREQSLFDRGERPVPAERLMRDARVTRIFEGSTEIMHLIMAREALDTHFRLIMPIMMPELAKSKESKGTLIAKAAKFYLAWYPKMWLPAAAPGGVEQLDGRNRRHLGYVARTSRRLARTIFHTMARYQQRLEKEQLLLANLVEIGVDLFVMAASLARAEQLVKHDPGDTSPLDLCDLFCKNARLRIAQQFKALKRNHNADFGRVADAVMDGTYRWMQDDIYGDVPVWYRQAVEGAAAPGGEAEAEEEVVSAGR